MSILPVSAKMLLKSLRRTDEQAEAESAGGSTRVMRHMFRRIIAGDYFPVPEVRLRCFHPPPGPVVSLRSLHPRQNAAAAPWLQCA
jgi:hypothetical protein